MIFLSEANHSPLEGDSANVGTLGTAQVLAYWQLFRWFALVSSRDHCEQQCISYPKHSNQQAVVFQ